MASQFTLEPGSNGNRLPMCSQGEFVKIKAGPDLRNPAGRITRVLDYVRYRVLSIMSSL